MKLYALTGLLGAVTVLACCQKNDVPQDRELPQSIQVINGGGFESGEISGTKAHFDESSKKMVWDSDDKIVVNGATFKKEGETNIFSYFSGAITASSGSTEKTAYSPATLYTGGGTVGTAKYTLPTTYPWDATTGKVDFVPMAGMVKKGKVEFHPLTSLMKITIVNNSGIDVRLFGVTLASDKIMSGDFTPVFDDSGKVTDVTFTPGGNQSKIVNVYASNIQDTRDVGVIDDLIELKNGGSYDLFIPVPAASYSYMNMKVIVVDPSDDPPCTKYYNRTKQSANLTCSIGKYYTLTATVGDNGFTKGIEGNGTITSPFIINDVEDLQYIKAMVTSNQRSTKEYFCNACYKLESDLTLPVAWTETMGESAVSGGQVPFGGVFDGNGHTISTGDLINTKPMFFDGKNGTIKNLILKGNFDHRTDNTGTVTFSPFMYAGFGDMNLVAVSFYGSVTDNYYHDWGTELHCVSAFGAAKGNAHLVGAYTEAKLQANATGYSDVYYQLFSKDATSQPGHDGYYASGVIGTITPIDNQGNPTGASATTYHVKSGTDDTVEVTSYEDKQAIVQELNAALEAWDNDLEASKGEIGTTEYLSKRSGFLYALDGENIVLIQSLSPIE